MLRRLALLSLLFVACKSEPRSAVAGLSATVLSVEGSLSVNGAPAGKGTPLSPGAKLQTGHGSRVVLGLSNGGRILVYEDTETVLGAEASTWSMKLAAGRLLAHLLPGGGEIRTANAVAGVRGTVYFVEAVDPDTTYLCACEGEIHVAATAPGGPAQPLAATHHSAVWLKGGAFAPAEMLHHTDAEVAIVKGP